MTITAVIPPGQTEVTVNGLHQWDYGQTLEIHDDTLPALVEIHFACAGMDEAIVRSSASVEGVSSAVVPDQCLEQISPVVAWVYGIEGTTGQTLRTIVLPIIPRTKPAPSASIPTYVSDRYTELLTAVSQQIEALKTGNVTVSRALNSDHAAAATEADYAARAGEAGKATIADTAQTATKASAATVLSPDTTYSGYVSERISSPGVYAVVFKDDEGTFWTDIICIANLAKVTYSDHVYYAPGNGSGLICSRYNESLAGYTIHYVTKLAVYPEG